MLEIFMGLYFFVVLIKMDVNKNFLQKLYKVTEVKEKN